MLARWGALPLPDQRNRHCEPRHLCSENPGQKIARLLIDAPVSAFRRGAAISGQLLRPSQEPVLLMNLYNFKTLSGRFFYFVFSLK